MSDVQIGPTRIGAGNPPFVIAEIGANFEHSFERACEMVRKASLCGVSAVKFQTYNPETNVTRTAPKFWDIEGSGSTQYEEQIDGLILARDQYIELKRVAEANGVIFFSSVCDKEGVDLLADIGVPAYKLASMEITNLPFLEYVSSTGKPIMLSTGASDLQEVVEAVEAIKSGGNSQIILLHCVSNYPAAIENVNLLKIRELGGAFPDVQIGYSDHTLPQVTRQVIIGAVALGAKVVEKHFTFDSKRAGYDHEISADYGLMKQIVRDVNLVAGALGNGEIRHLPTEERVRLYGRRGAVARVDISAGEAITEEKVIVKRPATGIQPKELVRLYGRCARIDIAADEVITWDMVEEKM